MKPVPKQRLSKHSGGPPRTRKGAPRTTTRPPPPPPLDWKTVDYALPPELHERVRKECARRGLSIRTFSLLIVSIALPQFEQAPVALRVP